MIMHTSKLREKYQYISPLSQYILYFIVFSLFFAASTAIENAGKRLETKKNRSVLVRCQLYRQRCTWPGRSSRIRRCWLMYVQQNHDNSFRDNVKNTRMAGATVNWNVKSHSFSYLVLILIRNEIFLYQWPS